MLAQEIIRRKRDNNTLTNAELVFMANGIADGSISEGQAAAFAMAVFFRGMSAAETATWTLAMTNSGRRMEWQRDRLDGPLLDKHSTGGVGDKTSLILAPVLAACGACVPMVSGRGLGHTGGTLDKLEAIPGFRCDLSQAKMQDTLAEVGCVITGASESLAPADRRLYAVRDVTATVDSVPLITASILSKKLAAGADGLVLDVKTGSGAFATTLDEARRLARSLVTVGNQAGLPTVACISDMNQVLGRSAGNALEVVECIDFLCGELPDPRLEQVVVTLGAEALLLGGLAPNPSVAEAAIRRVIDGGGAAERFQAMISAQGGPHGLLRRPTDHLVAAHVIRAVNPATSGTVESMDVRAIGMAVVELGGGRRRPEDAIDPTVGFTQIIGIGEAASPDRPLAVVHAASEQAANRAADRLRSAIRIGRQVEGGDGSSPPVVVEQVMPGVQPQH